MTLTQFNLTIGDGILLHLLENYSLKDEVEVPLDMTQQGIANAIGVRRSHVSYVLKSLKQKGFVNERLSHIKNKQFFPGIKLLQLIKLVSSDNTLNSNLIKQHKKIGSLLTTTDVLKTEPVNFTDNMTQATRFVGRREEIKKIKNWIDSDLSGIIVINGIPGVGKTTLAAKIIDEYSQKGKKNLFWFRFHE